MAELYTRDYFLRDCEGHDEFRRTRGGRLSRRLRKCLSLIPGEMGSRVVDVGCGRGEIALHLARRGARVIAVDPSEAALDLVPATAAIQCVRALGEALPLASQWAEAVVLSDVIEHLPPRLVPVLLSECRRVLRPGGTLVVHTQPNRVLVDWTVPILSRVSHWWGVSLPRDLRQEMSAGAGPDYHRSEQSFRALRRSLRRAGFRRAQVWLEGSYPIHRIFGEGWLKSWLLPPFRRVRWLKELFASQLFAVAVRPR